MDFLEGVGAFACICVVLWALIATIVIVATYRLDMVVWKCTALADGKCVTYEHRATN